LFFTHFSLSVLSYKRKEMIVVACLADAKIVEEQARYWR